MDSNEMAHPQVFHDDDPIHILNALMAPPPPEPRKKMGIVDKSFDSLKKKEKRREATRNVSRDRRSKEADLFTDLKKVVPLVDELLAAHVDKNSLLRVGSTTCRMRRNAAKLLEHEPSFENVNVFSEQTLTECLDGFVLLVDADGTILYVSESVSLYTGITQTDLVGRALSEFIHQDDNTELILSSISGCETNEALSDIGRYLVVRMKSLSGPRGRTLKLKTSVFKSILCRFRVIPAEYGRIALIYGSSTPAAKNNAPLLSNSMVRGTETTSRVYTTRHACDMRFSYVGDDLKALLRHHLHSLMGISFYDFVHPSDLAVVAQSFQELFKKAHTRTPFYRLLGVNSTVIWVQTEAVTISNSVRVQNGQFVLCVHTIMGIQSEAESWEGPVITESTNIAQPSVAAPIVEPTSVTAPIYRVPARKHSTANSTGAAKRQPKPTKRVDPTPVVAPNIQSDANVSNPACLPKNHGNGQVAVAQASVEEPAAKRQRGDKEFHTSDPSLLPEFVPDNVSQLTDLEPQSAFPDSSTGLVNFYSDLLKNSMLDFAEIGW